MILSQKNILVGVTGGIACYKSCELVRLLKKEKSQVHVVMTKGAQEFVTPMTFQALSEHEVQTELFDLAQESKMGHIQLADNADLLVIAPATANFIAKTAYGLCDDLLSTIVTVTRAPILIAPAMNVHMWENKIVQENVQKLKEHGFYFVGPSAGDLACGYEGLGRLEEPEKILEKIKELIKNHNKVDSGS